MTPPASSRDPSPLFGHLIPSLILAAVATVLFWWNPFGKPPESATFHVVLKSDVAGQTQLIHDVDGTGLHKGKLLSMPVEAGRVSHVRFVIPAGKLCGFILTGLDRPGEVQIQKCWITTQSGEVAAVLSPARMQSALAGAGTIESDGSLRVRARVGEELKGLHFTPDPPIDLATEPPPPLWQIALVFAGSLGGCVLVSLWLVRRRETLCHWWAAAGAVVAANPLRSITAAAVLSVCVCGFPVIFGGMSYVSPDNGMPLLYEKFPTVPGTDGGKLENPVGSDIGATMYWHLPASMTQHRAIFRDGELPLWNRYTWCGVTLFGQLFTGIGDPLHWLPIATGGAAWAWDAKFIIAKILFALGIGWLVLRTSRSLPVALLLTLSAPFIGFFAYRFCHVANFAVCYAPWILLAWIEGVSALTLRRAALWAGLLLFANWCQLNSGTAKEAMAFLLFLNAAGALAMLLARESWRWRAARLGIFAWANVLFVLLSAPLWLVFLDALSKAWTPYDKPQIYQMQPGLAIGLFDDIFHRQLMPLEFLVNPSANFFVLLGVAWALVRVRPLMREQFFLPVILLAIPAVALAFGVVPPSVAAAIPLIKNIYHFDNTFSCVLFILLFVIAGFGLRECLARMRTAEWRGDWIIVLVIVGVLLGAYFGMTQASHRVGRSFLAVGETIPKSAFFAEYVPLILAALALLPWALREAVHNRQAAPAWAAVAVCLFGALHFRHGMYFETKFDLYTMNPKARLDLRSVPSPALEKIRKVSSEPARVLGLDWEMTPGFNTALGLETISGPDALLDPAMLELTAALGIPRIYDWRLAVSARGFEKLHRSLDFLNVRYLLQEPGQPALPGTRSVGTFDMNVSESETAWPRAFFTDAVTAYADLGEFNRLVQQGDGRPFAAMPPDLRAHLSLPEKDFAQRIVAKAGNYRLTNNTTSFEIDAPSAGLATLMEANAPGEIQAFVDGQPVPCLTVDHVFRGVLIEKPGQHVVKFAYWPRALGPALWIAGVGLAALAASGWLMFRRLAIVPVVGTLPADASVRECTS